MGSIFLFFEKDFDFFLSSVEFGKAINYPCRTGASIKDIIEFMGVPHTEVGQIFVKKREGDFSFRELEENNLPISCRTFARLQGVVTGA